MELLVAIYSSTGKFSNWLTASAAHAANREERTECACARACVFAACVLVQASLSVCVCVCVCVCLRAQLATQLEVESPQAPTFRDLVTYKL